MAELSSAIDADSPLSMSHAVTWRQRQEALHSMLREYSLSVPNMQTGIIQLFERETADPNWEQNAEFDDFNQYYEEVSELCQRVAQTYRRQDAWRALAYSTYNPTSQFGRWLIAQPESFAFFLEMYRSSNANLQGHGMQMLGEVLQRCGNSTEPHCSQEILKERANILAHIRKVAISNSNAAAGAILSLGDCGGSEDIALLEARASELRKQVINPADERALRDRDALLWLIKHSERRINAKQAQ